MPETWGQFSSPINVSLLKDGRNTELLLDVTYTDPAGKMWSAPKGFISDGASIPQVFWSIVGGPWDGPYRNAAIVHDQYCVTKSEPSPDVHRMFYKACRAEGVTEVKAKALYAAVRIGGPKWGDDQPPKFPFFWLRTSRTPPSIGKLIGGPWLGPDRITAWVESNNPSLEDIDKFATFGTSLSEPNGGVWW
jgi:hypothetical protein